MKQNNNNLNNEMEEEVYRNDNYQNSDEIDQIENLYTVIKQEYFNDNEDCVENMTEKQTDYNPSKYENNISMNNENKIQERRNVLQGYERIYLKCVVMLSAVFITVYYS